VERSEWVKQSKTQGDRGSELGGDESRVQKGDREKRGARRGKVQN